MESDGVRQTSVANFSSFTARPKSNVHGRVEISFSQKSGQTRLSHLYQRQPLRVLHPRPLAGDILSTVLVNTSGGLVGGDCLQMQLNVGSGAKVLATTQAADKVYRSTGADSRVTSDIYVADGAWLEWLPHETIIFEAARLRRRTTLNVGSTGRLMAGELLVFGRSAHGESLTRGLIHDEWSVRFEDRLIWSDSLHLVGDLAARLAAPAGFGGSKAAATFLYVAQDAQRWLDPAREVMGGEASLKMGVSCLGNVLVARWLGEDPGSVRHRYGQLWAEFRSMVGGLPPMLPSIWNY